MPPRRSTGALVAFVVAAIALVVGVVVAALQVLGDGSVADGVDRVADLPAAVSSQGPIEGRANAEVLAACNGQGDPRFDPYDPNVAPSPHEVAVPGHPPVAARPTDLVYSVHPGPLTEDGIHSTPRSIEVGWGSLDAARTQLLACVTQQSPARLVGTCTNGIDSYEATFRVSLRVASTGAEIFAGDFVDGDGCAMRRHLDPTTESVWFHTGTVIDLIEPYVTGPA